MRQVILASKSRARAELLSKCGFEFRVEASDVDEIKHYYRQSIKQLVIHNALLKVRAVASRYKSGVVVAADTVVLQDKKVFGKPKDKKEAFRIIKKLSLKPSYVWTGVAVVDIENKRTYTDCEKTKVWIVKLSDRQIRKYLSDSGAKHINFAGGFDIQGKGSLFIERIEGCFYNVVGLPLAKLYALLKRCAISI